MREVRLRAYDKLTKRYGLVSAIDWVHGTVRFVNDETNQCYHLSNCVLLQYTGLDDDNGNEIYEGDIISYFKGKERVSEVIFDGGEWSVKSKNYIFTTLYECSTIKVIGNIYEETQNKPEKYVKVHEVEAIEFLEFNEEVSSFTNGKISIIDENNCVINSPQGNHVVTKGDFIVKDTGGRIYPCRRSYFKEYYNKVE